MPPTFVNYTQTQTHDGKRPSYLVSIAFSGGKLEYQHAQSLTHARDICRQAMAADSRFEPAMAAAIYIQTEIFRPIR